MRINTSSTKSGAVSVVFIIAYSVPRTVPASEWKWLSVCWIGARNHWLIVLSRVEDHQFSLVAQSCPAPCYPIDCSMTGLPVHHQIPDLTQTHVHQVGDAIQPYPLSSPSPPAFNLSQQQGLFKWVSSSHQVVKVLEFQLQHLSFQWIFSTDFL